MNRKVEYRYPTRDDETKIGWLFRVVEHEGEVNMYVETEEGRLLSMTPMAIRFVELPGHES